MTRDRDGRDVDVGEWVGPESELKSSIRVAWFVIVFPEKQKASRGPSRMTVFGGRRCPNACREAATYAVMRAGSPLTQRAPPSANAVPSPGLYAASGEMNGPLKASA